MTQSTALQSLAGRLSIDATEMQSIVMNTVMPNGGKSVTEAQFTSFIAVANEYQLNPLTKEIYAFPAKGGGIQPIVSIDGWLKIINTHPQFDGMEFDDKANDNGKLISVTCKIYRKDRSRATEMTEYMDECVKNSEPWKQWPSRMLRHKATIQAARYAFGLSGIIDPDEAERFQDVGVIEKDITPDSDKYPQSEFDKLFPQWETQISNGKKTAAEILNFLSKKVNLSQKQIDLINSVEVIA
jgi:phage recombination protein Bet